MKKKFKGQVYRDAIEKIISGEEEFACHALGSGTYSKRFSEFFSGKKNSIWVFERLDIHTRYRDLPDTEFENTPGLPRRTREIALELAAHLEDIGEMDKILGEK